MSPSPWLGCLGRWPVVCLDGAVLAALLGGAGMVMLGLGSGGAEKGFSPLTSLGACWHVEAGARSLVPAACLLTVLGAQSEISASLSPDRPSAETLLCPGLLVTECVELVSRCLEVWK